MAVRRFMGKNVSGINRIIRSLVAIILLWILMFVFEQIIDVIDPYLNATDVNESVNSTGTYASKFGNAITLLDALPEIIGLIASVFLIMDLVKGFKNLNA